MKPELPAPDIGGQASESHGINTSELSPEQFHQAELAAVDAVLHSSSGCSGEVLSLINQLDSRSKMALVRKLITHLDTEQIKSVLEFSLREIGNRHSQGSSSIKANTRLLLKKDYSYQAQNLQHPTQYYVYLRRRNPKLDRYIGTLFYIAQGCTLSYFLDASGSIVFNPPHNIFQLQDSSNPALVQVVRLLRLEPPPPDYTFTKQKSDTPDIRLHLEYLDVVTHEPIAKQIYPFPSCMHEGGRLDRYRWEVSVIAPCSS